MVNAAARFESQKSSLSSNSFPLVIGILLCATAVFLYFYAATTFSPLEYQIITLPVFASGLILIFFNFATLRELAFPLAFLLFLTPPSSAVLYSLSSLLSDVSAHASAVIVNAFGMHSTVAYFSGNPNIIMTKGAVTVASFVVDFTCSGINGLVTFAVFTVFLAYLVRDKLWKKISIVAIGFPLIYSMNILRISSVLAVGFNYGTATAESIFHTFSGLILTFIGALILALIAQKALKANFYRPPLSAAETCANSQIRSADLCVFCEQLLKKAKSKITRSDLEKTAAIALIVVTLMAVQAPIYALARTQTNLLEQVHQGQTPSTNILPQINNYVLNFSFEDKAFEAENQEDATVTYCYTPNNSSQYPVWVVTRGSFKRRHDA